MVKKSSQGLKEGKDREGWSWIGGIVKMAILILRTKPFKRDASNLPDTSPLLNHKRQQRPFISTNKVLPFSHPEKCSKGRPCSRDTGGGCTKGLFHRLP